MCAIELYRPNYGGSQLVLIERLEFSDARARANAIQSNVMRWKRECGITHLKFTRLDPPNRPTLNHAVPDHSKQYAAVM